VATSLPPRGQTLFDAWIAASDALQVSSDAVQVAQTAERIARNAFGAWATPDDARAHERYNIINAKTLIEVVLSSGEKADFNITVRSRAKADGL